MLRWSTGAEERRRKLERELAKPLDAASLEKVERWLRNIEAREAWLNARLNHLLAVKALLADALRREAPQASTY